MIDSIGRGRKVNNILATLNIKPISEKNLIIMEERAGKVMESLNQEVMDHYTHEAYVAEIK